MQTLKQERYTASDESTLGQSVDLVSQIYDTALQPSGLPSLLEAWAEIPISKQVMSAYADHFARAKRVLAATDHSVDQERAAQLTAGFGVMAAFAVNRTLQVVAANPAAETAFGIVKGSGLTTLPLNEDDMAALFGAAATVQSVRGPRRMLLRCHSNEPSHLIAFQVWGYDHASMDSIALIVTSEPGWTDRVCDQIRQSFGLSNAELEVLLGLVECQTPKTIAATRGRSLDTVRSQIRAILNKTDTHSQTELVRLTLSLVDAATVRPDLPRPVRDRAQKAGRTIERFQREDGRHLEFLTFGDPRGRPILFMPMREGLATWPAAIEARATTLGLRIIVPQRAGYGGTTPHLEGADRTEETAADHAALLDHLGISHCPVLAFGNEGCSAITFAARYPKRVKSIVLAGLVLPFTSPRQLDRMDDWARAIHLPSDPSGAATSFLVQAACKLSHKQGRDKVLRMALAKSPADLEILNSKGVQKVIEISAEIMNPTGHAPYAAFLQEAAAQIETSWSVDVQSVARQIPIEAYHGMEDSRVPAATLAEFRSTFPEISVKTFPDEGQLVFFGRWAEILDRLAYI